MDAVIIFGAIVAILVYLYLAKAKRYDAIMRVAELGEKTDDRLIEILENDAVTYKNDYRKSLIWAAIGIPTAIGMYRVEETEWVYGLVPLFISVALAISGWLRLRDSASSLRDLKK